jgi:hypothetical protein
MAQTRGYSVVAKHSKLICFINVNAKQPLTTYSSIPTMTEYTDTILTNVTTCVNIANTKDKFDISLIKNGAFPEKRVPIHIEENNMLGKIYDVVGFCSDPQSVKPINQETACKLFYNWFNDVYLPKHMVENSGNVLDTEFGIMYRVMKAHEFRNWENNLVAMVDNHMIEIP